MVCRNVPCQHFVWPLGCWSRCASPVTVWKPVQVVARFLPMSTGTLIRKSCYRQWNICYADVSPWPHWIGMNMKLA